MRIQATPRLGRSLRAATQAPGQTAPGAIAARLTAAASPWAWAALFLLFAGPAAANVAAQGDLIVNTATVTAIDVTGNLSVESTTATVTVRIPTPATLELLEYAPRSPKAVPESVLQGAYFSGTDPGATLHPLAPPRLTGAANAIDLGRSLPLLATGYYHQGDPVFIRVGDRDQNSDRVARDTVQVLVTDDLTGDSELVRLTEDGPDTGVFVGYLPTQRTAPGAFTAFDGILQVVEKSRLTARYTDSYDAGDVLSAAAVVDPLSLVFNSRTGLPVSGAAVTVVDVSSGQPATVLSDDGLSTYPSTVTSGKSATDGAGRVHSFSAGEFRFPFLRPGSYRYDVKPPAGFAAPSKATDAALQALPGAPFTVLDPGSRGETFLLDPGPALRLDVPIDPASVSLWVQKTASREVVGVGDALSYEIAVSNTDAAAGANAVRAVDQLPVGFRYRRGSTQLNGLAAADPAISLDGQTLTFNLGDVPPATTSTVRFLAQVGAGVRVGGTSVNLATATSAGGAVSNLAQASVRIADDFFSTRGFILGRVTTGECSERDGTGSLAVPGVRVLLEDGTFAVSDPKGLFHFEGVRPGLHVVQLDLESLPEGYEAVACTQNDRFAGRAFSQFVELKGETAWRADFHLRAPPPKPVPVAEPEKPLPPPPPPPPPPAGEATLELSHQVEKLTASFKLDARGTRSPLADGRIVFSLPTNLAYEPGSCTVDGVAVPDPDLAGATVSVRIGEQPADWSKTITFRVRAAEDAPLGGGVVSAELVDANATALASAALSADNGLAVARELLHKPVQLVIRPHFPSFGTELSPADKRQLDAMAKTLLAGHPDHLEVVGHTDSQHIAKRSQKIFKDNAALSLARALSVGKYLLRALPMTADRLQAEGMGESQPLASNASEAGMATNRRVEVIAFGTDKTEITVLRSVKDKSGQKRTETHWMNAPKPAAATKTESVTLTGSQAAPASAAAPLATGAQAAPGAATAQLATAAAGTSEAAPGPAAGVAAAAMPAGAALPALPAPVKPADGFIAPLDGELLAERIGAVQLRAPSFLALELAVDGAPVDAGRIGYKNEDHVTGKTTYTFVGVDLGERGPHTLTVVGKDPFGNARLKQEIHIVRTGEIAQIRFVSAEGNIADGRTPLRARLQLIDSQGQVIQGSIRLVLREGNLQPLRLQGESLSLDEAVGRTVPMDKGGLVQFAPVVTSGSYRGVLAIGNATVAVETWASPKLRDWVLVGLAEGTAGFNVVSGNLETLQASSVEEDLYASGRVALYAKGQIAGKWLATVAYDSARAPQVGTSLFQQIDPNTYFTLYGDASQQGYDAASARKIYVKIEREQFYALFGDYDTGLTVTELSRYSRKMNGAKAELQTQNFEVNAFGARTDQTYARDEIPGDGTSGLYHLSRAGLTVNSETVTLLTRDRFRSEVQVEARTLTRFIDYSIDYDTGTIFFREPVPSRDFQLNPVTIVVEYESAALGKQDYTVGGRAGVKLFDQRVRAGVTAVHEGQGERKNDLYGADARIDLAQNTRLRGEYALTNSRQVGAPDAVGSAFLGELSHTTKLIDARLYFREQQGAFGLGQQSLTEAGTRKLGGDATLRFSDRLALSGQAYRQDTFSTGAERLFGETRLNYTTHEYGGYVGLLDAEDRLVDGTRHSSGQITAGGKLLLLQERLTLGLDYAQSVWGNASSDFPTRLGLRVEYKLTQSVALLAADEVSFGAGAATNNERVGLRAAPWKGGSFTSLVERDLNENESRVFGNLGLRQTWQLSDAWKIDAGAERSQTLRHAAFYQPNPAVPPASGAVSENFTAATAGANYQVKSFVWDSRIEGRTAASGDKLSLLTGLVAERSSGWAFAGRGQLFTTRAGDVHVTSADLRFGFVFRPEQTRWILLNRTDLLIDRNHGGPLETDSWRIVDNFIVNWRPRKQLQVAVGYGAKYGRTTAAGQGVEGFTDEVGLDLRYDVTETIDVGLRGSVLHSWTLHEFAYSGGPSIGVSPATNVWISVGVNVVGYEDRDFTASGYQARGPYLRLRFKFDQQSVRDAAAFLNKQ